MDLKKQAVSGMFWVFIDTFLLKGVSFIGTIFLARLLMPEDFGLIAMISIIIVTGVIVIDSGLSSSLIRNIKNTSIDYSTVFYANVFFSLIFYIVFFFLAPFISRFYDQESLVSIIRVYSLCFFSSSFSSVQIAILIQDMQFKRIAYLNLPGSILGIIIGLTMGYYDCGVWSIVGMYLGTQFFQLIALWIGSSWKPKLEFSFDRLYYHYQFGFKLLLSSLLTSVLNNIYNVVIGKFYSLKITGYFERSNTLSQYPVTILTQIIGKVTFPLMAGIQEDKERLKLVFQKLINFTFFVTSPIMMGVSAVSKPLILLILGKEWLPAVPILQIICFSSVFLTLQALNVNVLKIYGRSDLILYAELLLKIFLFLSVFTTFFYGLYAIIWCMVINSFVTLLVNMYCANKVISFSVIDQLKNITPVFLISITMYFFLIFLQKYCENLPAFIELSILSFSGFIFFIFFSYLFKVPSLFFLFDLIKNKKV